MMSGISKYMKNITNGVTSIYEGMAVTMSWMFRKPHTIQYPYKLDCPVDDTIQDRFRGVLEVVMPLCTACLLCERTCPIDVIKIEASKGPDGNRYLTRFDIDAGKCMYCGLCTEACPSGAIRHTKEFAFACDDLRKLTLHFVHEATIPRKASQIIDPATIPPRGAIVRPMVAKRNEPFVSYDPPQLPAAPAVPTPTQEGEAS